MRNLLLCMLIPMLMLTGCSYGIVLDTENGKLPTYVVHDQKDYFDFNASFAYDDKIYRISEEVVGKNMLGEKISQVKRDVTSHALINGDFGFFTSKKIQSSKAYPIDVSYQKIFDDYKKLKLKGNEVFKLSNTDQNEAIAIKIKENEYRKFTYAGKMNGFYQGVEKIIKPIVFVPFLIAIFLIFLVSIIFFD